VATLTLAQYAQLEKQPLAKGIMMGISQEGLIADIMNFRNLDGALSETGVRYDEVIEPDWIPLDGTINSGTANGKPLAYSVYQMAKHIDVPVLLDNNNKTQLARASVQQTKLAIKGAAYKVNDCFINGDQASDANQFEGINKIVGQMGSTQIITPASEIDISTYNSTEANELFDNLDKMFWACEGHKPDAVFCNDLFLLRFESVLRQAQLRGNTYDWVEATFKIDDPRRTQRTAATKPAYTYKEVPFFDIGVKADQSTRIITSGYTDSLGSNHTRVFAVKFGEDDVEGLQAAPLQVKDIGNNTLEDKEVMRKRLTWTVGLGVWGPRSIVRLDGIKT